MTKDCAFCMSLEDETIIKKYEFWTVHVNYSQPTLGSAVIILNEHREQVSDVTLEEDIERYHITKELETSIRSAWNHNYANNFMLANKVRHIHYHFVPRYADERVFSDRVWKDTTFGSMPNIKELRKQKHFLEKIISEIQKNLPKNDKRGNN